MTVLSVRVYTQGGYLEQNPMRCLVRVWCGYPASSPEWSAPAIIPRTGGALLPSCASELRRAQAADARWGRAAGVRLKPQHVPAPAWIRVSQRRERFIGLGGAPS